MNVFVPVVILCPTDSINIDGIVWTNNGKDAITLGFSGPGEWMRCDAEVQRKPIELIKEKK